MQNSLAEVELSATSGDHVFGEKHSKALEDLRMRQLKLARAWARNEAEDEIVDADNNNNAKVNNNDNNENNGGVSSPVTTAAAATTKSPAAAAEQWEKRGSAAADGLSYKTLDEETERDIILARERREANDRYFNRVSNGVLDVVSKLEDVAQAMRMVEKESQDIWSDSESSRSSSAESPAADAKE